MVRHEGTLSELNPILKGVSRSFYLSIRVLPQRVRHPVAIAYLMARAADTISDTPILPPSRRIIHLQHFRKLLNPSEKPTGAETFFQEILQELQDHDHPKEKQLLKNLQTVFVSFQNLTPQEREITQNVLLTLTQGMCEDLEYFSQIKELRCFKTSADTDRYTYMVAGCVGEFWTDLLMQKILRQWNRKKMVEMGTQFGKGLQMINILRDLPKDMAMGRCYLSDEDLAKNDLNLKDFANFVLEGSENGHPPVPPKIKAIFTDKIQATRNRLAAGLEYVRAIPRMAIRLRLAVLWPLFIGLETLNTLQSSSVDQWVRRPIRISRSRVYRILFFTLFFASSNTLINGYYTRKGGIFS